MTPARRPAVCSPPSSSSHPSASSGTRPSRSATVYLGDAANATIYAFDLAGQLLDWADISDRLDALGGLEFDAEGCL